MRKTLITATAALMLASSIPAALADTDSDTLLPEPPSRSVVSYSVSAETQEGARPALPAFRAGLEYWEATRDRYTLTGEIGKDVVRIARSQLGYREKMNICRPNAAGEKKGYTRYGEWYGWRNSDWCDMFVSFCIYYAGNERYPFECSCLRHELALKEAGYWRDWNCYLPQPGDLVFFKHGATNGVSHAAIVEMVIPARDGEPAKLITIDGNVHDEVDPVNRVKRIEQTFDDVVGYATYTRTAPLPNRPSERDDTCNLLTLCDSKPVWEVLSFIGATDTVYARTAFPDRTVNASVTVLPAILPDRTNDVR